MGWVGGPSWLWVEEIVSVVGSWVMYWLWLLLVFVCWYLEEGEKQKSRHWFEKWAMNCPGPKQRGACYAPWWRISLLLFLGCACLCVHMTALCIWIMTWRQLSLFCPLFFENGGCSFNFCLRKSCLYPRPQWFHSDVLPCSRFFSFCSFVFPTTASQPHKWLRVSTVQKSKKTVDSDTLLCNGSRRCVLKEDLYIV